MRLKYIPTPLLATLLILLLAGTSFAGWGDALKTTTSQYADDGATTMGLPYTPSEAVAGIKEVLSIGTNSAVSSLGKEGGFSSNPAVAIPMPDMLKGLLGDSTGLTSAMNSAAESVVPSTGNIFLDTIQKLSIDNPTSLLGGGEDAITKFFEASSRDTLKDLIKPLVKTAADQAGVGSYLTAMTAAQQASSIASPPFDAYDYVADYTLDGMFYVMASQEKDIRSGNGASTSDWLKKLF